MKRAATRLAAVLSAGAMMCVVAAPAAAQTGNISGAPAAGAPAAGASAAGGTPLIGVNVAIGELNALNDLTANVTLRDVLNDSELLNDAEVDAL